MVRYNYFRRFFLMAAIFLTPDLYGAQNSSGTPPITLITTPAPKNNTFYVLDKIWRADGTDILRLKDPEALSIAPDGTLYIADTGNNRIVVWVPDGKTFKTIGTFGDKADWKDPPEFNQPSGILIHPSGQIYVGDTLNHRVVVLDANGMAVTTWGSQGTGNGEFNMPRTIAKDHFGNIWVLDSGNSRVQIFSPMGEFHFVWGSFGNADYLFNNPMGMAVNHIDQGIIADTGNFRFEVFDNRAVPVTQQGWYGEGPYQFKEPAGATITPTRLVAIADGDHVDFYNGDDDEFEYLGRWKAGRRWAGLKNSPRFHGITSDRFSRIYLTDITNNWVVRIRPVAAAPPRFPNDPTPTPESPSPYDGNGYPIR